MAETQAGDAMREDRRRWNERYSQRRPESYGRADAAVVSWAERAQKGAALDLAAGTGGNSLALARRGFEVTAVDVSDVSLEILRRRARDEGVLEGLHLVRADLDQWTPPPGAFQLVVCARFLSRPLCPAIVDALAPGGLLLFQTFTERLLEERPNFPADFCLRDGEPQSLFPDLECLELAEVELDGRPLRRFVGRKARGASAEVVSAGRMA